MLKIESPGFATGGDMPSRYTCDDANTSPPLRFSGLPDGVKSLALIVDDPDAPDPAAPKRVFVHWVLYNLPATVRELEEGVTRAALPADAREGINDNGHTGYDGPCPPIGRHRYFHKLYALDVVLPDLGPDTRKTDLERAMRGHVLAEASIIGTYQRGR
jgi:Raf kinase inhibitor-like YbhB/YbcL family protein